MNIHYALSPYPALLENMFAKAYEASSPYAEVASFEVVERDGSGTPTPGAGHQVPVSITFTGLDFVTHIIRLFTASATLLHQYDEQPSKDIITIFDPIYFVIGDGNAGTPIAGTSMYSNGAFSGLNANDISVSQQGYGFLIPNIDYTLTGSTITLINSTVFEAGQPWYIQKKPSVIKIPVNDSVVGKGFGGFVDVVADVSYIPGHLRKLVRFSGTGDYTFPADAEIPIGYNHTFSNFGDESGTPRVNFFNGTLAYGGTPKSFLVLTFGSTASFTWDGESWNCFENSIKDTAINMPVAGDVVGQGTYMIGDVPAGDTVYTITHGLSLAYSYRALFSIRSNNTNHARDNTVTLGWYDPLPDSFKITVQEIFGEAQDVSVDWVLVKS